MRNFTSRSVRSLAAVLAGALTVGACSEPGSLVIALGIVPDVTASSSLAIDGTVTRTPTKETEIVITASGGRLPVSDTAAMDGSFSISVPLAANTTQTITLTAQDGTGSVSAPVTVTVRQDGVEPQVTGFTPSGADVSTQPTIEVTFSEPVRLSGTGAIQLLHNGATVPASALLASDSLRVTLSLGRLLTENAVYLMAFPGVTDIAGNGLTTGTSACFVTANTAPAALSQSDPTGDIFTAGTPSNPSPSDLDLFRLSLHSDTLFGVLRFTTPRSFGSDAEPNNAFAYIGIDLDQDSATGYGTYKDTIFATLNVPSGLGAEAAIWIDWFPNFGDSAIVGQRDGPASLTVTSFFLPDVCGRYMGFAIPFASLGADDGDFDYVILAGNSQGTAATLYDPMPESGHYSVAFAGLFVPPYPAVAPAVPPLAPVARPRHFH